MPRAVISFTESALRDLEEMPAWYVEGVPDVGTRLVAEVSRRVEVLADHPNMGRVVPEFDQSILRELIHPPFRIVYQRDPKRIRVVRVWRSERWPRNFYLEEKASKKIPAEVGDRLFRKLQLIDDATCDLDLRSPPSNHFGKLRGNLAGKHSIRINKQWRLVFTWSGERGEAQDIYLDNHDYR